MKTHKRFFPGQWLPLLTMIGTLAAVVCPPPARGDPVVEAWARRYSNLTESQDQAYRAVTDSAGNVIVAGYTDEGVTGSDMLLIKYSGAGAPLWTNRYNGPANSTDQPSAVAVDGSGTVFVTGLSYGGANYFDYLTIAYSSAGAPLWTNRYDGPGNYDDEATAVAVDGSGNVIVTGYSVGIGTSHDYLTIKYSSAGVALWTNRYNGPGNGDDYAYAVAVDGSGNVFVTGNADGGGFNDDYATVAYSSLGATLWVRRYNGPANSDDYATALAVDGSGNVYVTGYSGDDSFFDDYATVAYSGAGVALWTNRYNGPGNRYDEAYALRVGGNTNVYVTGFSDAGGFNDDYTTIAYSTAGVALWTNRYNGPGNGDDYAYAVAVDGSGNVFVTGRSDSATSPDYATIAYSSTGTVLWVTRYNGPGNRDEGYGVAVNNSGNVIVTGYSRGSNGSDDWATIAYSGAGVALWTNRYNGPGNSDDYAYAVAVDGSSNVLVTGSSSGIGTREDYLTIKYSSAGVALWTNRFNGPGNDTDQAKGVAVDGSGNVYVTGSSQSATSEDYATIAYSSTGAALWTNYYGGPIGFGDQAQAIAVDGGGNVLVTGYSQGTNGDDYATIKYSSAGVALWTNRYDGPGNGTDQATALAVDGSGVYVTGYSSGGDSGDDYATVAYSSSGVPLWTNRYNGLASSDDHAQAVAVDGSGNVYVTGYSYGIDTSEDYATIKYSSAGVALWTNRYNGPGNSTDVALSLAVDGSGNVFVTGYSQGGGSDEDCLTIAYSSAGLALWTNRYNGLGNRDDRAQAVVVDGGGRVFVTGYSYANDYDYVTFAYSTAGVALWTNHYNAPFDGYDQPLSARSMAVAGIGSVVVTGQSRGTLSGAGIYDYATVKYITVPQLAIRLTSTNTALVSWPFPSTDFTLQQNTNLGTANWIAPSETVGSNGTNKFIIVNPPTGKRFYRLRLSQ